MKDTADLLGLCASGHFNYMKVSREGHPEAAMTPGRTFSLRGGVDDHYTLPSSPSLLRAALLGLCRGESCLFIHALADSWLQLAEDDGTRGGGEGTWGRTERNQGGEILNQSRSVRRENKRDVRGFSASLSQQTRVALRSAR